MEDFTRAINEIKPAFGMSLDAIEQVPPPPLVMYPLLLWR